MFSSERDYGPKYYFILGGLGFDQVRQSVWQTYTRRAGTLRERRSRDSMEGGSSARPTRNGSRRTSVLARTTHRRARTKRIGEGSHYPVPYASHDDHHRLSVDMKRVYAVIDPTPHSPVFSLPFRAHQLLLRSHVSAAGGICLRSRPSRQPQSAPHFLSNALNLSSIGIDILFRKTAADIASTGTTRSTAGRRPELFGRVRRSIFGELKMWTLLIAFMLIIAGSLDAMAQTADDSPGAGKLESRQRSHVPSTSTPLPNTPGMNTQSDCNGQPSSTPSVTVLLSRLIQKSIVVTGSQCPIPPVPDTMPIEEPHP
jgi:hypothetical protein